MSEIIQNSWDSLCLMLCDLFRSLPPNLQQSDAYLKPMMAFLLICSFNTLGLIAFYLIHTWLCRYFILRIWWDSIFWGFIFAISIGKYENRVINLAIQVFSTSFYFLNFSLVNPINDLCIFQCMSHRHCCFYKLNIFSLIWIYI